jgi:hypothetical protein
MNTDNTQNNPGEWVNIEGFSKYEANGDRVRNRITGRMLKPVDGRYFLYDDDIKKQRAISVNRLLYAMSHHISPDRLDGLYVVSLDGKLELKTKYDFLDLMRGANVKPQVKKEVVQCNLDALAWLQKVILYYETEDITDIALELNRYKKRICAYIVKCRFTNKAQVLEEVWNYIYEDTLCTIAERKENVFEPFRYMSRVAINYISRVRSLKKTAFRSDESKDIYL